MTPEEKRFVRGFVQKLAAAYEGGWTALISDAGINTLTAQAWRYNKGSGPSAPNLLKLLRTAGALQEDAEALMSVAEQDAAAAFAQSEQLEEQPPRSQARNGSKQ